MATVAKIVVVEAPDKAAAGSRVDVRVSVENLTIFDVDIAVAGDLEYGVSPWPMVTFPQSWARYPARGYHYFDGYFTMPSAKVKLHIYSYYFSPGPGWIPDDEKVKEISLTELVPGFSEFKISDYKTV